MGTAMIFAAFAAGAVLGMLVGASFAAWKLLEEQ
jgi:hypothetical protein